MMAVPVELLDRIMVEVATQFTQMTRQTHDVWEMLQTLDPATRHELMRDGLMPEGANDGHCTNGGHNSDPHGVSSESLSWRMDPS